MKCCFARTPPATRNALTLNVTKYSSKRGLRKDSPSHAANKMLSDRWERRFRQLEEFKEEHGHCDVPWGYWGGLGHWANRQHVKKESKRLDAGQIQKLEELGFRWKKAETLSDRWETRLRELKELDWIQKRACPWEVRQLKEFKEEYGHCDVPSRHPGGLRRWVECQRHNKGSGCLDGGRIQKLEELGVQWGRDRRLSDLSEARFRGLKEFKEDHGHCNVPWRHSGGLGYWVSSIVAQETRTNAGLSTLKECFSKPAPSAFTVQFEVSHMLPACNPTSIDAMKVLYAKKKDGAASFRFAFHIRDASSELDVLCLGRVAEQLLGGITTQDVAGEAPDKCQVALGILKELVSPGSVCEGKIQSILGKDGKLYFILKSMFCITTSEAV